MNIIQIGQRAKKVSRDLALVSSLQKNNFLLSLSESLEREMEIILGANQQDIEDAKLARMPESLIDRLLLNENRIRSIATDLRNLAALPDPIGQVIEEKVLHNGLNVSRKRVPLGVMAVIYEARPNVTVDISALAIKAGNAAILRGGKETLHSNLALIELIHSALQNNGLPVDAVQYIDNPDRTYIKELVKLDEYVDLLIPRGGTRLQQFCKEEATMPVMTGGIGICHLFVDESADLEKALDVVENAKVQRPSVCNALDTLLVHKDVATYFVRKVIERLTPLGVSFKIEGNALSALGSEVLENVSMAEPGDFDREWLSLNLSVMVVNDLDEAIEHIWKHSTHHSDGILTGSAKNAEKFIASVDSAAVYVNASTRFTDGAQLGLGGEVAVSTQKMHARGPVGLEGLTTYKWILQGNYHIRE